MLKRTAGATPSAGACTSLISKAWLPEPRTLPGVAMRPGGLLLWRLSLKVLAPGRHDAQQNAPLLLMIPGALPALASANGPAAMNK